MKTMSRNLRFTYLPVLASFLVTCGTSSLSAQPAEMAPPPDDEYSLDLPDARQLFRLESEERAKETIRKAAMARGIKRVEFPVDVRPPYTPDTVARPDLVIFQEPTTTCFRPLYFQDVRTERLGISCGVFEPIRSAVLFYGRVIALPLSPFVVHAKGIQCWHP